MGKRYVRGDWMPEGEAYPAAKIDEQTWNGWACPNFDLETARRVVADQAEIVDKFGESELLEWVEVGGQLHVQITDPDGFQQWIRPDAEGLYAIGSWAWTWYECDAQGEAI